MKKRLLSMILAISMVVGIMPLGAFATQPQTLCQHQHDQLCGFVQAIEEQPCGHLNTDGSYQCAPALKDSEAAQVQGASPVDCGHEDGCGYTHAVQGASCTHTCELCMQQAVLEAPKSPIRTPSPGEVSSLKSAYEMLIFTQTEYTDKIIFSIPEWDSHNMNITGLSGDTTQQAEFYSDGSVGYPASVFYNISATEAGKTNLYDVLSVTYTFNEQQYTYTITTKMINSILFDAGAGTLADGSTSAQIGIENGQLITEMPANPTPPAGSTFKGWYYKNTGGDFTTEFTNSQLINNATVYAKYEAISAGTQITKTLEFKADTSSQNCTNTTLANQTGHTHADGNACWNWDLASQTLTLNNLDMRVTQIENGQMSGIVLPEGANTVVFEGKNTIFVHYRGYGNGIESQKGSLTLTGAAADSSLKVDTAATAITAQNNKTTITKGVLEICGGSTSLFGRTGVIILDGNVKVITTQSNNQYAFAIQSADIQLLGGTVSAQAGAGCQPFSGQPTLLGGMEHDVQSGAWNNTAGAACIYKNTEWTGGWTNPSLGQNIGFNYGVNGHLRAILPQAGKYTYGTTSPDGSKVSQTAANSTLLPAEAWNWNIYNNNGEYILTLNNATMVCTGNFDGLMFGIDLTLVLIGNNTITTVGDSAISSNNAALTIKNDPQNPDKIGTLSATGKVRGISVAGKDFIAESGKITAQAIDKSENNSEAISVEGKIILNPNLVITTPQNGAIKDYNKIFDKQGILAQKVVIEPVSAPTTPSNPPSYQVISGNGQTVASVSKGATFRFDMDFANFAGVWVDGSAIASNNYTAKQGSVILTLKPAYLASLPKGKHTVTIIGKDGGMATASLFIGAHQNPNTGVSL